MALVAHIISKDHVIKDHVTLWAAAHQHKLPFRKFGAHRHYGNEDVMILACRVILQDNVIKGSCDFLVKKAIKVNCHLAKFGEHRHWW